MASSSRNQGERADLSGSGDDVWYSTKDIFLSHSGRQKDFVENLYYALERANQKPFLDIISLPKASRFPDDIKRAVRDCKLGVVVLSHDFMISKWPMLELEMLFGEGKPILPLFYKLSTEDLKSDKNLSGWREKWETIVKEREDQVEKCADKVNKWERHVRELCAINGIVFKQQSENTYINIVVSEICTLVPSQPVYDLSFVQGLQHLTKEVRKLFDERRCGGPRMVGLHGVGGLGKTTLCMSMVNFYNSAYNGRSYLIEFPTDGDESTVLQTCKKTLMKLGSCNDHILSRIDRIDQVVEQMKKHAGRHDMFLAFDNVWSESEEATGRFLSVGFTAASKILLTSRSEQVLRNLLDYCNNKNKNSYVGPLPALKYEDALKLFEQSGFTSTVRYHMDYFLEKCRFGGNFHPLALNALAKYVRKNLDVNGHDVSRILNELDHVRLEAVEDCIKINYQLLSQDMQCLFLDIALLIKSRIDTCLEFCFSGKELEKALVRCLCFLYKEFLESKIIEMVYNLAEAGVIQREADEVGQNMIRVHDLYLDLAQKEVGRSRRFLTFPKAVERIKPRRLESVMMFGGLDNFIEILQQHRYPKVKFCCYDGSAKVRNSRLSFNPMLSLRSTEDRSSRISMNMNSMPSLRILMLTKVSPRIRFQSFSIRPPINLDLSGICELAFVSLMHCNIEHIHGLSALRNLQMLLIGNCLSLYNLDGLSSLKKLEILALQYCWSVTKLPDVDGLTGLEKLVLRQNFSLKEVGCLSTALKEVDISHCCDLKKLPDVGGLTLESLTLKNNDSLEEVGCLSGALKKVDISYCKALKKLSDFGGLTGLEKLTLAANHSLEEVGRLSPALKEVDISFCDALKKVLDVGGLTGLQRLTLRSNCSLEEVGLLSPAVKEVDISFCDALKKFPDVGGLTGLQRLTLRSNCSLEEVGCLSVALKEVTISECSNLDKLPDFGGLTALERLRLDCNQSVEVVECWSAALKELTISDYRVLKKVGHLSPALKEVNISGCWALKKLSDVGGLTGIEVLSLQDNKSLEEVGCLSAALKNVNISECGALKKLPDIGGLTGLETLTLASNGSLEEVGCLSAALKKVNISGCEALKKLPDICGLTALETLNLIGMWSMEEVGRLSTALKALSISGCCALQKLPDMGGLTGLEALMLNFNTSLVEVGCLSPALQQLTISSCGALKKLPDSGGLPGLKKLSLYSNDSLEEVGCLSPAVEEVTISFCGALKKLPDIGGVPGLKKLWLDGNHSLEEVGCLSPALQEVTISRCDALKNLPDIGGLTRLCLLKLQANWSLEEVGCLSAALQEVTISRCAALKKLPDFGGLTGLRMLTMTDNGSFSDRHFVKQNDGRDGSVSHRHSPEQHNGSDRSVSDHHFPEQDNGSDGLFSDHHFPEQDDGSEGESRNSLFRCLRCFS